MEAASAPRIRPITLSDESAMAAIIRSVMMSFGAQGEGFSSEDPEVDTMCQSYSGPRARYYVVELEGRILGGAGIAPLSGAEEETCELRKMYFLEEARGRGLGWSMLELCLAAARELGFKKVYLETLADMDAAGRLYERGGFQKIDGPQGRTGHHGCDSYYLLEF